MDTVLEKLLESPKLNLIYAQLDHSVDEEQVRREQFYATLCEDEKSEFACRIIAASRAVAGFAIPVRAVFDVGENLAVLGKMLAD
ncbi:MAG: hypothetical protein IAE81_23215 [Caldilineaceae bacterium]|nr:hypothetical protein [Caldilineaceae bacterium]